MREGGASDSELVASARRGSIEAFGRLYLRHHRAVRSVLRNSEAMAADLDDLVQDVFLRALAKLDSLAETERFGAWVCSIARHVGTDHVRRQVRRPELRPEIDEQIADDRAARNVEVRELATLISAACSFLTPRDAVIIYMTAFLGFTPSDVAGVLALSPQASKVAVHRARRRLHDVLAVEVLTAKNGVGCHELRELVSQGRVTDAARLLRSCPACDHAIYSTFTAPGPDARDETPPRCAAAAR